MGIPKLTKFISRNYKMQKIRVTDGKIVIDGTSLCYNLNPMNRWELGGDYYEFYVTVTEYFRNLQELKIDPYVLFDGMDQDNSKYSTYISRNEQRINHIARVQTQGAPPKQTVRPLFAKSVFIDAVRDLGIKFVIADGEADRDVVSLANYLQCPVLSDDSDYYVFNVEGGYIPITDDTRSLVDLSKEVRCFFYRDFDQQYNFNDNHRLFLPFFLGNDFQTGLAIPRLGFSQRLPVSTITPIIRTTFMGDQTHDEIELRPYGEEFVKRLSDIYSFYRVLPRSFEDLSSSTSLLDSYPHTPKWILDLYKCGQFMAPLISLVTNQTTKRWRYTIVVEDFSQHNAWDITRIAKKFIIGALLGTQATPVFETVAQSPSGSNKITLVDQEIKLTDKHCKIRPVPLVDIPKMAESDRRQIVCRVFDYQETETLPIPDDLKLAVIASSCWIRNVKHDKDSTQLVKSLVFCILTCNGRLHAPREDNSRSLSRQEQLSFVHIYAQWQCMLHHVIAFNQVLNHPFPYASPGRLFSTSVLLHYYLQDHFTVQDNLAKNMIDEIMKDMVHAQPKKRPADGESEVLGTIKRKRLTE